MVKSIACCLLGGGGEEKPGNALENASIYASRRKKKRFSFWSVQIGSEKISFMVATKKKTKQKVQCFSTLPLWNTITEIRKVGNIFVHVIHGKVRLTYCD